MRSMIGRMARAGILAAGVGATAGGALAAPGTATTTPSERIGILLAQVLGTTCETPDTECTTDEAPVGSICQCGDTPGTIVAE